MWKQRILKSLSISENDKISIFINKTDNLDKVVSIIRKVVENSNSNFRVTSFDVELPRCFQDLNIKIEHSGDYLDDEDCIYVDKFFFKMFSKKWFTFNTPEQSYINEYRKNLLGRAIEFEFIRANFTLIKYLEVMRKIFINYKPTKILIVEDAPYLVNIIKLFNGIYDFKFFRINPYTDLILNRIKRIKKSAKEFLIDLAILFLDFFVWRWILISKKSENKIIIDYRLYKRFMHTRLKEQLLICPFEKGLKVRLEMLSRGLFYLPMRLPSYFDYLLQDKNLFRLIRDWKRIKTNPDIKDTFRYKDIIFWDAIEKYIFQSFLVSLPRVIANITTFQKFVQKKKVKLIVMRNGWKELERNLIEVAQQLRIPNLVVQHGILGDINMGDTLYADMTAGWGNASIDWFKQFGYKDDRFSVTGNPMYDELYHRISANHQDITRKKVCQKLNLTSSKKIITFLTSSNFLFASAFNRGDEMNMIIRGILGAFRSLSDVQLIIKLHPYDDCITQYADIVKEFNLNSNVTMTRKFNTFDILEASDLVIVSYSSCGLEALILDKPLIAILDKRSSVIMIPYVEEGVAIGVRRIEDIELAIKDGLYNEKVKENLKLKRKEFIFNYAYKIDGQATKRAEDLIYNLIKDNEKKLLGKALCVSQ